MTTANLLEIVGYDNLPQNTSGANADSHQPPACRNSNTADFRDCSASVHRRFVHQRVRQIDNTVIRLVGKAEIFRRPRPLAFAAVHGPDLLYLIRDCVHPVLSERPSFPASTMCSTSYNTKNFPRLQRRLAASKSQQWVNVTGVRL